MGRIQLEEDGNPPHNQNCEPSTSQQPGPSNLTNSQHTPTTSRCKTAITPPSRPFKRSREGDGEEESYTGLTKVRKLGTTGERNPGGETSSCTEPTPLKD